MESVRSRTSWVPAERTPTGTDENEAVLALCYVTYQRFAISWANDSKKLPFLSVLSVGSSPEPPPSFAPAFFIASLSAIIFGLVSAKKRL